MFFLFAVAHLRDLRPRLGWEWRVKSDAAIDGAPGNAISSGFQVVMGGFVGQQGCSVSSVVRSRR